MMIPEKKSAHVKTSFNPGNSNTVFDKIDFIEKDGFTEVVTSKNKYASRYIIVCGGLQADRLAKKDNVWVKEKVVGFRGDYYELTEQGKHKIKNLIYPVPNPDFPFLGVHFTRMTDGEIECGPNAVFTFKREGYKKTDFSLRDSWHALTYGGTWKLFFKHWKFGLNEYRRAFSKRLFLKQLKALVFTNSHFSFFFSQPKRPFFKLQ